MSQQEQHFDHDDDDNTNKVERDASLGLLNDTSLDHFFDELISLGGGGGGSSSSSPSSPQHSHGDLLGDLLPPLSPNNNNSSPDVWRLSNPVHMEIQENAKLPTFNLPVDRSNSTYQQQRTPSQSRLLPLPLLARNTSLAEQFLGSPDRHSLQLNYAQVGALRNDPAITMTQQRQRQRSDSMSSSSMMMDPLDLLAAQVEPTPLDEIKRKHEHYERKRYPRHSPLPIPNVPHDALATAAAIASTQASPLVDAAGAMTTHATTQHTSLLSLPPTVRRTSLAPSQFIGRPSGAMARASQQKAQYGFGTKHVVPSIPVAPTATIRRTTQTSKQPQRTTSPAPSDNDDSHAPGGGGTGAYERKKQRAKDARVKLNDSIERLSIAVSLAGTQSKQRLVHYYDGKNPQQSQHPSSSLSSPCTKIMRDCVQIAESAKKWDRPSFVATAAALIQGLNAQCEGLLRELLACQQQQQQQQGDTNRTMTMNGTSSSTASSEKRPAVETSPCANGSSKRPRVENGVDKVGTMIPSLTDGSLFGIPKLVARVASFLDPVTVVRCTSVSKLWKYAFSNSTAWDDFAVVRFGYYNVRQWKGKLEDDEGESTCPPLVLYRSMDGANTVPHVQHEGMFLLGEARMPGKVSAWVYLVERSNGETLRSVRRHESMPGGGAYASLPVVELRLVVQNTGSLEPVVLREQLVTVDASTRRTGLEMKEVDWDERLKKRVLNLDGSIRPTATSTAPEGYGVLTRLKLFEAVILEIFIHAKGCSTSAKFVQRSNFTKILVQLSRDGTTLPLVVPFPRDSSHQLDH